MDRPTAITILSEAAFGSSLTFNQRFKEALRLAIQDLKRCQVKGDQDEPLP